MFTFHPSSVALLTLFTFGSHVAAAETGTAPTTTGPSITTVTSISQHGITWTFDGAYTAGQFVNGDWWVVGPVSIIQITPGSSPGPGRIKNGSQVNPNPAQNGQGYDNSMPYNTYQANLNVADVLSASSPLVLQPGSSLISTISVNDSGERPQVDVAAVLTVLSEAAPATAFRPPYAGSDKTLRWHEGQLDYSVLLNLPAPASAPSMSGTAAKFSKVWLDHRPDFASRYMHPDQAMPDYGRDLAAEVGTASLLLNLDFSNAQKRDLLIGFVQLGIDTYGVSQSPGGADCWVPNGGHASGRKWPIVFAGMVLGDADLAGIGLTNVMFGEDAQTFYVEETSPGVFNNGNGGYNSSHAGMPEYGIRHATQQFRDDASWDADYRQCCTATAWAGEVLSAMLMEARPLWNHDSLFDYQDRYVNRQINERGADHYYTFWSDFHKDMWLAYRSQAGNGGGTGPGGGGGGSGGGGGGSDPIPTPDPSGLEFAGEGAFRSARVIDVNAPENTEVRYTLDGTEPTASSPLFDTALLFDDTTELRARTFENGEGSATSIANVTLVRDEIARYDFEGEGSTAFDGSQFHRDGSVIGGSRVPGLLGQGMRLDGGSERIELGSFAVGGGEMTLGAWFRADNFSIADARLFSKASGVQEQDHVLMVSTINAGGQTRLRFRLRTNGTTTTLIAAQGALQTGAWHHVVARYDGSAMDLFLDGVLVGSTPKNGTIDASSESVWIGNNPPSANRGFDGIVDELLVYDFALTDVEIRGLAADRERAGIAVEGRSTGSCGADITLEAIEGARNGDDVFLLGGAEAPANAAGILLVSPERGPGYELLGVRVYPSPHPEMLMMPISVGPDGRFVVTIDLPQADITNLEGHAQAVFLNPVPCPDGGILAASNGLRVVVQE